MWFPDFNTGIAHALAALMRRGVEVNAGSWQGYVTGNRPDLVTLELLNLQMEVPVGRTAKHITPITDLADEIKPNLPWADNHFHERVSRVPSNPGAEYENWPWWQGQKSAAMESTSQGEPPVIFSHTYQERFWPKHANRKYADPWRYTEAARGIRYRYGDLDDVVNLLIRNPFTRQAYLPIFFPEDTGAVHGGRTPCTLGYHFMLRENRLNMWYHIRSCDAVRHFRDDLYLACRLLHWVILECRERVDEDTDRDDFSWQDVLPGTLFFTAYSFHIHKGDLGHVNL